MPDPKLVAAIQEIQAILNKYDIAGIVHVASQTHTHYMYGLSPSWSAAKLERGESEIGIRVRAKLADFPNIEAQKKCLEETVGMIAGFRTVAANTAEQMETVLMKIAQHIQFTHIDKRDS